MCIVSSGEFHRKMRHFQDRALVEPVFITRNGRERTVMLSADEYRRLKQLDRQALPVTALSERELQAIMAAEVPPGHEHLDAELRG
jgi:PHD/YefM family antitoxin component YafN of YafNO toxin-antitoxin module